MTREIFESKRNKIMTALLDRKGMQHIINTASDVFGNPVFVGDISLNVLCYSETKCDDPFWNIVKTAKFANENILKECSRNGAFNDLYSSDRPQFIKFSFTDKPFLAARIRGGANILAHANVYGCINDITKEDAELLVILCKVLAYEMLYRGQTYSSGISYYNFMSELLSYPLSSINGVTARASNSKFILPDEFRVAAIRCNENGKNLLYYLRDRIVFELYGNTQAIIFKGDLIVIFDVSQECYAHNITFIEQVTSDKGYSAALSRKSNSINQIKDDYDSVIGLLNARSVPRVVQYYDRDFIYHIFSQIENSIPLKKIAGPEIGILSGYDSKNKTYLLSSLKAYLKSGRNINISAERLFIHKNTMYYRKKRIEELLGVDLDNEDVCFSLEVELKMDEYSKSKYQS